ncbi:MAG: tetratricopeptide repeat protein [Chitinophagales bacterium]
MAKNKPSKKALRKEKQQKNLQQSKKKKNTSFWQKQRLPLMAIAALSFVLYIYTTSFDYVLDDQLYITKNDFTKQGFSGIYDICTTESLVGFWGKQKDILEGGRYRPLAIVSYAVEYQLWGEKPGRSHFFNVVLYCLVGILLYRILCILFPPDEKTKWYLTLPFIAAALYVAHPLHSEVVANIKGRVEILASLGVLATLYYSLKYIDTDDIKYFIASFVAFFLALLSKESAITFVAIIPLTIYFFTKATFKKNAIATTPLLAATVLFLVVRYMVIGYFLGGDKVEVTELLNDPFLGTSFADKYATIFYTLGIYIKLLLFPLTLTHDYYPKQIPIITWADPRAIVPLLMYIGLGLFALWGLLRKNVVAYGILVYLLSFSIVSNLVFSIGAFMNERFMYLPSIGFCIIIAYLLVEKVPNWLKLAENKKQTALTAMFAMLLLGYSLRTLARIPVWETNETLFLADVHNSPNSTKANTSAGGTLIEKGAVMKNQSEKIKVMTQGIKYLDKALQIYPDNINAHLLRGNAYYDVGRNYDKMFESYNFVLSVNPNHADVQRNLNIISEQENDPKNVDKLINFYETQVVPLEPSSFQTYDALGVLYGKKKNDLPNGIKYFEKALEYPPANKGNMRDYVGVMQDLAIAYGMSGKYPEALETNKKALEYQPNNAKILLNIGITYQQLGDTLKAQNYMNQAVTLDPKLRSRLN